MAGNFLNMYATTSLSARTLHNAVISLDVLESIACPLQLTSFKVFDRRYMGQKIHSTEDTCDRTGKLFLFNARAAKTTLKLIIKPRRAKNLACAEGVTVLNTLNFTVTINVVEFQRHNKCRKNISQIQGFITSKDRICANDYFGFVRKGVSTACSNVPVQDLSYDVRVLNDAFLNQVYYTSSNGKVTASSRE
jgi:hypothetical protein